MNKSSLTKKKKKKKKRKKKRRKQCLAVEQWFDKGGTAQSVWHSNNATSNYNGDRSCVVAVAVA